MKIEDAIQQKSFNSEYHKAQVNLLYTVSWMNAQTAPIWKKFDLTMQQFNVLRILKGSFPAPLSVKDITAKMLDRSSNASRLVDKLLEKKLVERTVCPNDRRKVEIIISDSGIDITERASAILKEKTSNIFKNISKNEARELSRILDDLRG